MANGHVQNDATKKAIATLAKCLSSSAGFVPLSSSISRASFTESAPLQRSIPRENKNLNFFATFSRLAIPSLASNSGNRPFGGRFAALSLPISAIGEPATIANRKKVAIYAVILFLSPEISGGAINRAGSHCRGRPREGAIGQINPCRNFLPVSPSGRCKNNQKRLQWNKKGSA